MLVNLYRTGKGKQIQLNAGEGISVAAKHTAVQAFSRLRAAKIRLDKDVTLLLQLQNARGLPTLHLRRLLPYRISVADDSCGWFCTRQGGFGSHLPLCPFGRYKGTGLK